MGDELDDRALLQRVTPEMFRDILAVLRNVYASGYITPKTTFAERREVRAKSYRVGEVRSLCRSRGQIA